MNRKPRKYQKVLYGGRVVEIAEKNQLHKVSVDGVVIAVDAYFNYQNSSGEFLKAAIGEEFDRIVKESCKQHGILRPTNAALTKSSKTSAKNFIFCNVPGYSGHGNSDSSKRQLIQSIQNSLKEASSKNLKTVGIASIKKDFPVQYECEAVMKGIIEFHFANSKSSITTILLLPQDDDSFYGFTTELANLE